MSASVGAHMTIRMVKTGILCAADEASARLAEETGKPDIIGAVALDTSNPESISAAVQNLAKGFEGKLDTLINNAAVSAPSTCELMPWPSPVPEPQWLSGPRRRASCDLVHGLLSPSTDRSGHVSQLASQKRSY